MRYRITLTTILMLIFILLVSVIDSYKEIQRNENSLQTQLLIPISQTNLSLDEIHQKIAIYQSMAARRILKQSRARILPLAIQTLVLGLIFILLVIGVTQPLSRLSREVSKIDPTLKTDLPTLKPAGSIEVRNLTRVINELLTHIQEYQSLIGDKERYRGWREISRVIVHELNNILSPIRTYAEYLIENPQDTDKVYQILAKLEETQAILKSYRELAHLPQAHFEILNLVNLCRDVCNEFPQSRLISKKPQIPMSADPILLKEILRNLIKNACESVPNALVEVRVESTEEKSQIQVKDNGPGINPELVDHIFEPGFTTKDKHSGIGLALILNLVREHQGQLRVENNPGQKGCSFYLTLPHIIQKEQK